ncbi:MAG TPA: extracellular solute-binding protein [Acidimicrobiales bacterium]|nr:extracellular solute-binding protein [Acidimicrobiales bacterium]
MRVTKKVRANRLASGAAVVALVAGGLAWSGGAIASASSKVTITAAYAANTTFDTTPLGYTWWHTVAKEFDTKYPNYTVKLVPVDGGEPDFLTKLALLYHSSSTAPTIAQFPSTEIALYASTGYLMPMNTLLKGSTWFSQYPTVIQNEGNINGKIYAVSAGENNNGIYYDKAILQKAGISLPWQPKNWQDIITAAKAIKKAEPNVIPLWLDAGTSAGPNGAGYGILNLLAGSSTPTIETKSGQMVVSSPGLLQTLNFYHEVFADGLGAPTSQLFSPNNAPNIPSADFAKGTLGIAVAANFIGGNWTKQVSFPYWKAASTAMGVAGLPNAAGTGYASTLSGWDYGISSGATSAQATAAIDFLNIAQDSTNLIDAANWAGWVPPVKSDWTVPLYTNFDAPFAEEFGKILPYSSELPSNSNYSVWVQGIEQASGAIAEKPSTTGAQAEQQMSSFVTNDLGSSAVATIK